MHLWGIDAGYARLDLYNGGSTIYFTLESFANAGVPIVVPMGEHSIRPLIELLQARLAEYELKND